MFDRRRFIELLTVSCSGALLLPGRGFSAIAQVTSLLDLDVLEGMEKDLGGRLGVSVRDLETGATAEWRADERFAMNSTFKFMLVAATLKRIESGQENFERGIAVHEEDLVPWSPVTEKRVGTVMTVRDLCHAVLTQSDNLATNYLLHAMGGPEELTLFLRASGDEVTICSRFEPEANSVGANDDRDTSTPNAMSANLQRFLLGDVLSDVSKHQLFDWMQENSTGLKRIRAGLPEHWVAGDRTGTGSGGRASNIAIAYPGERKPVLISVYTDGSHRYPRDISKVHAEIGRLVAKAVSG